MMLSWETLHAFPPELNWPKPLPLGVGGGTLVMDWRFTKASLGPLMFFRPGVPAMD